MKLLYLAEGQSVHSIRWIRFFADQGHDVDWISLAPPVAGSDLGRVRFHLVPGGGPQALRILRAVALARRLIRDRGIDLLHSHYAGTYGLVGALCGFHPAVLTAWGSDVLLAGKARLTRPLVRFALAQADLLTCDAGHMVRAMVGLGVPEDRIAIIYFGTDTTRYHPGNRSTALRERLGVGASPLVVSVRTLHPNYDNERLIRAIPAVLQAVPDVRFVLGGDGPDRAPLVALASELGVSRAVSFVGQIPPADLPAYLATADIYVSTSPVDGGLSASTAEAMASATPVVVTEYGENRLWVEHGVSGLVVPMRDAPAVAEALIRLLRNPEERRRLGAAGREVIDARNNYQREMARMGEMYERLVRERAGTST